MKKLCAAFFFLIMIGCSKSLVSPAPFNTTDTQTSAAVDARVSSPTSTLMTTNTPKLYSAITKNNITNLTQLTTWWTIDGQDILFTPDSSYFIVARHDGIYFYDPETAVINSMASGNALSDPQGGEARRIEGTFEISSLSMTTDGSILASGTTSNLDSNIRLWNASTGGQLWSQEIKGEVLWDIQFSPDGKLIASKTVVPTQKVAGYEDPIIRLWNVEDGSLLLTVQYPIVSDLIFSNNGSSIIAGIKGGKIIFINTTDGKIINQLDTKDDSVFTFAYSPDDTQFISGSIDGNINVWELPDYKPIRTTKISGEAYSLAFLPNSSILIVGTLYDVLYLIDTSTGEILREIKLNYTIYGGSAIFAPNRSLIAVNCKGPGAILFWGVPS
jgi:WD40 repeat protein